MRAYGSKYRKITAIAVAAVLVFAMVLSAAAYAMFKGNTTGGNIIGGINTPVRTADITSSNLKSNDAVVNSDNTVRLNQHTTRNNVSIDVTDTAGGKGEHTSQFPTNYVEIPSYGVEYNLSSLFADAVTRGIYTRAVGIETYKSSSLTWYENQIYNGGGNYASNNNAIGMKFTNSGSTDHMRIILYMTLALPDSVAVENGNVSMNFSAVAKSDSNNGRQMQFGYSVIAETGENGINSVLTGRENATGNSLGLNTNNNAVDMINASGSQESLAANQSIIAREVGTLTNATGASMNFSTTNSSVPSKTRFIRIMLAYDARSTSLDWGRDHSAFGSFSDIKVTFNDSSTSIKSNALTVDSANNTWTNEKLVTAKFNAYNGGLSLSEDEIKQKVYLDLYDYNANNGEGAWVNNVKLADLNNYRGADGRLLAEYVKKAATDIQATDLDGNLSTKSSEKVGVGVQLKLRTSRVKIRFNNGGDWIESIIDRSSEGTGATGVIQYLDSKLPINNNINIMITNLLERGVNMKISEVASGGSLATSAVNGVNVSQDKLYYYFLGASEQFDSIDLSAVNGTEITGSGGQSLTTAMLQNLPNTFSGNMNDRQHGQYKVVFYVKDIAGNAAPITVRTKYPKETHTDGAVHVIVDESGDITNGSLEATIERFDKSSNAISGKTETDWTKGTVKLTLRYTKNENTSYTQNSGVIFKINVKDRADAGHVIELDNPYTQSAVGGVYTASYVFGLNSETAEFISQFYDIKIAAMKGANESIEQEGRFVDDNGTSIDKTEYTVRVENADLEYAIKSIDENGIESGYLNDSSFINGNKNIAIVITGGNDGRYVSLYDEGRKMYIQYALLNDNKNYDSTVSDLAGATWISADYNMNNSAGQVNLYLGIGGNDIYSSSNWIRIVDKDGNPVTSHTGKIIFRVALFDGEWLYFDAATEENVDSYSNNALIVNRIDNVIPEADIAIFYQNREGVWDEVVSEKWFSRDAKVVITLKNYNDIMSLNMSDSVRNMVFEDMFGDPNLNIYCSGGSDSEHLDVSKISEGIVVYTFHIGRGADVNTFVRRFGLKIISPAGNGGEITTANGVEEPEGGFWLYYDNILPALVISAGDDEPIIITETINMQSLGKWYNYDIEFRAGDNGQEHSPSGLKYTIKVFEGELSYEDCIGGSFTPILTDEFSATGNYTYPNLIKHNEKYTFLVDVVSGSDRFRSIAYTVKVDTVADGITLGDWTTSSDNVKYITDENHTFNANVVLDNTGKSSENKYIYMMSEKVLTNEDINEIFAEIEFDALTGDMVITDIISSGGNISVQHFGDYNASNATDGFGKGYVYIFSYDEAGNIGIATATVDGKESNTLEAVIDSRDYSVVLSKSSDNGTFNANSESITVDSVTKTVKAGSVFTFEADANSGSIFLGYKTDVDDADEVNASASKKFIVAYNVDAAYAFIAIFKKIVTIEAIDNNMQIDLSGNSLSIALPTGTATVGANSGVEIDLSSIDYLKIEYYADGAWRGSNIDKFIGEEGGNYSYRISISDTGKYDYYMSDYYMSSVVISNRLSLRIDFDINNTSNSYVYNNVEFITLNEIARSLFFNKVIKNAAGDYVTDASGNYILSVERPIINTDTQKLERTEDFTEGFINGILNAANIKDYLTVTDRKTGETVDVVKNAGEYRFTFSYRSNNPQNTEDIADYDISFSYDFDVKKREFTVTPIENSVNREYNGTNIVEDSTNTMNWADYITLGNLANGENMSVLNLMADSFTFDSEDVIKDAYNGARISGFRFSNGNYVYNGANEIIFEDADITPFELLVKYTGLEYSKIYDGTDRVKDEDIAKFEKLLALINGGNPSDYYFTVKTVVIGEDVSFGFDDGVLVLDERNAGDRTITISKDDFKVYVGGVLSDNYTVIGFQGTSAENVIDDVVIEAGIEKKEITISNKRGVRTYKEFDANGFTYALNYDGLVESDITVENGEIVSVDSYGIPTVFSGVYTVLKDGATPPATWDQGSYILTFDNSLIDNYIIIGANEFEYLITPKELYIRISKTVGADDTSDASQFVNFKYYDALAVGYEYTFTANGTAGANSVSYTVSDNRGDNYDMIAGYSIDITFDMPNAINAMTHEIGRLTSKVSFNGEATGNYSVQYTRDENSYYEIRKRPLIVAPNITALEYTGETQVLTFSNYTGADNNFTITDGIADIGDSWTFDAHADEFKNASFNMSFTVVDGSDASGINVGNYHWRFLSDAYKDQLSLQNYSFSVSEDANVDIIAAQLYLKFNASHFAGTHYYDDRSISLENKLPSIIVNQMNGNFDIIDSTGSVTTLKDVSVGNILLEYKINNVKTGNAWAVLNADNYTAGQVQVYTVTSDNNSNANYTIVNLVDGEAIKIPSIGGGNVTLSDDAVYGFDISPVTISISSNLLEQNYMTDDIATIAKKAFTYSISDGAYLESEGLHAQLDLTKSTTVKLIDTDTNQAVASLDPNGYLDAGTYKVDFTILAGYFTQAPNYRLVFTSDHNNRITINKVAIYARITAPKNGVYDSNIHIMEAQVFVDEYGRVIADENSTEVAYFVAQSALGENAINQGQYKLVYVDSITRLDQVYTSNISSMKNYIFNTKENNIEGSNSYTITKRAVNINMVRKDGLRENTAIFGEVVNNNGIDYTFDLVNSFDFTVFNYADNETLFKEKFASNLKYDFTARSSSVTAERTVYDIKFNGYANAIQDQNYVFNISEISGFILSKKIIEAQITYNGDSVAPTTPTYGKDANSFDPSKIAVRYRFRDGRVVIDDISNYLVKTPKINVIQGEYNQATDTIPYVYTLDVSGIAFRDGIGAERPLYETYTLRNMTDEGDTQFVVNIKRASLDLSIVVGVEEPTGGYVYGKNGFDPNNVNSYRVNAMGRVEGDELTCEIVPEFVKDNGDGTITFKATLASYSIDNEVFYKIEVSRKTIEYTIKKANITVGIAEGGASGNIIEYNANFLNYFTSSIAGLPDFDKSIAGGILTKFKITKAVKSDKDGYSNITVNIDNYTVSDSVIDSIEKYYIINIADGDGVTVEAKRAVLSINAGVGNKEYSVDYSEDTYPFANMQVTGFVFDTDKSYVFTDLVDEATSRFLKLDPNMEAAYNALTVQNEPISINGSSQFFKIDDTLIAQSEEMYLYDVNMIFVFKVNPCVITASINKKNAEGENGYSFVFGSSAKKIYDSIEIVILRESDATNTPIKNDGIINVEGESEIGASDSYYPIVGTHFIRTNFKLVDKVNYTLVRGDMDTVSVKVTPKELKYRFLNDDPITAEFGEYTFLEESELFAKNASYSIDSRQFVPGYESIEVSVVRADAANMSVAVGKYALALKTLDRNYTLALASEPCYYEVKAKGIDFNFADIEKDYGFTLADLKSIYDYSTGKREAILQSYVKDWTNIKDSVRKEIMNNFTFSVSGDVTDIFAITSDIPYTVSVSFGGSANIVARNNTFELAVNPIALDRAITNGNRTETFKGLGDAIALGIVSNHSLLNIDTDITVEITKDGAPVDSIIEVGEYNVKITSNSVNFVGEKSFTVTVEKKDYVTSAVYGGGVKTIYYNGDIESVKYPTGYDTNIEIYSFDITLDNNAVGSIDEVVSTNLGEYAITLSVLPNEAGADNNYNASVSSIRIRVVKEVIDFAIDLTTLNQIYGETYPIVAGNEKLSSSDYTVVYKDAKGADVSDKFAQGKIACGKYTVVLEKTESCMYDVASVSQTLIINKKVIDIPSMMAGEISGEFVSGEGVTFDSATNKYKAYYSIKGINLGVIENDRLFGEFAEDIDSVTYLVNGKETNALNFTGAGVYNVVVSYSDNDGNVTVKDASFTLEVYKLILNSTDNIGKIVFESDIDTFSGEAPQITMSYVDGDDRYEIAGYTASFAIDNGTRYIATDVISGAGKYRITVSAVDEKNYTIASGDAFGIVEWEYEIKKLDIEFAFGEDIVTEYTYGEELNLPIETGNNDWAVEIKYYAANDKDFANPLETIPTATGKYVVGIINKFVDDVNITGKNNGDDNGDVALAGENNVLFSMPFEIKPAEYSFGDDVPTIENKVSLSKLYDGANFRVTPDMTLFSGFGLPEGTSVVLEAYRANSNTPIRNTSNCGTYTIKARFENDNYDFGDLRVDYGTYTVTPTDIQYSVDRKTTDTIIISITNEVLGFEYEYSIDGGKTWTSKNRFTGLDADTEYTVMIRVNDDSSNFLNNQVDFKLTTAKETKITDNQIMLIAIAGGAALLFIAIFVIIMVVRKKRSAY